MLAHPNLRGQATLVTASCPQTYPHTFKDRQCKKLMIPGDFEKEDFLKKIRMVGSTTSSVLVQQKAACVDEPHRCWKPSSQKREGHKHFAMVGAGTFALADALARAQASNFFEL